ncbi:WhiB family transcriptional regulator [Streptomyces bobili]|uniref:WhiB family transcriptional regulator n=1 Tax=Streptomyces bobili TaxID=67280 RepID=UPI0034131C5A
MTTQAPPLTALNTWRDQAECVGAERDVWAGDSHADIAAARAACLRCPVLGSCLRDALRREASAHGAREGVRAALTGPQRAALVRDAKDLGRYDAEMAQDIAAEALGQPGLVWEIAARDGATQTTARLARRMLGRAPLVTDDQHGSAAVDDGLALADDILFSVREESPAELAERLEGLSSSDLKTVAVVLAALADPTRPMAEALAWTERDTRDHPADLELPPAGKDFVDENKTMRALEGEQFPLSGPERAAVIRAGMLTTRMSVEGIGASLGLQPASVKRQWARVQEDARDAGEVVPMRTGVAKNDVA